MRFVKISLVGAVLLSAGIVFAQESEFQGKIQEDLDGYKAQLISGCGTSDKLTMRWQGKLGSNPRESEKPEWNAISTLCTSGLDGIHQGCMSNAVVKKTIGGVKTMVCTKGKGTLDYKLKGSELTILIDPSFTKNNPSGQTNDFVAKLKKDLDK